MIHRDIKPANVLVRTMDPLDLVLTDFGIALASDHTLTFGPREHSVPYVAPEALAVGATGASIDWWSLGMTLAELALGRHPYQTEDGEWLPEHRMYYEIVSNPVPLDGIDDERLLLLLRGLLTRGPADRWRGEEVRAWLEGGSPPVATTTDARGRPLRTFHSPAFGRAFTSPAELAAAMARDWSAAERFHAGREIDELGAWLSDHFPDIDIVGVVDGYRGRASPYRDADRAVTELIARLDPRCEPTFRGLSIRPVDLPLLADSVASAGTAGRGALKLRPQNDPKTLDALHRSQSLRAFAAHARHRDLAEIDARWQALTAAADTWFAAVGEAGGPNSAIRAACLAMATGAPQEPPPSMARDDPRLLVPWYVDLQRGTGAARDLDRGMCGLLHRATAGLATKQGTAERVRRAEEQRRRRAQAAQRRTEAARARGARRSGRDRAVLITAGVMVATVVMPWGLGSVILAVGDVLTHRADQLGVTQSASDALHLQHLLDFLPAAWAAGGALVLLLAALIVLLGSWEGRTGRVIWAVSFALIGALLVPSAISGQAVAEAKVAMTARTAVFPFAQQAGATCGNGWILFGAGENQHRIGFFAARRSGTQSGCDRVAVYSGWSKVGDHDLPSGATVLTAAPADGIQMFTGPGADSSGVVLVRSDGYLTGAVAADPMRWWQVKIRNPEKVHLTFADGVVLVGADRTRTTTGYGEFRDPATGKLIATASCRGKGGFRNPYYDTAQLRFSWVCADGYRQTKKISDL